MKRGFLVLFGLLAGFCSKPVIAQKINLQKWVKHQKDSLTRNGIDTIIYYHNYCGECNVIEDENNKHCEAFDNGWTLITSCFIYKKNGDFFSLEFNCYNSPIKRKLDSSKSIPYFLSKIPVLRKRDLFYNQKRQQVFSFPPTPIDGGYEEATIYFEKKSASILVRDYQKNDGYKYGKNYFWIDTELKIMELIEKDLK